MTTRKPFNRRSFVKTAGIAAVGMTTTPYIINAKEQYDGKHPVVRKGKRIGIIGLDTSHSIAFTKSLNTDNQDPELLGYKVTAAYPHGSKDIETSTSRIPGYTKEIKEYGVEIVSSISELLDKTDVILLETNDGRRHLEQVLPVLEAGKRVFIDKPVAASLSDALKIYEAADKYGIPTFSSSSLRYIGGAHEIRNGSIGKVVGANAYSPAKLEKTHPDMYWYGIHGVETLFTVMGTGCQEVYRVHTDGADVITGIWQGGRIGVFRGIRDGKGGYGGMAFGEKGQKELGPYNGYVPLLKDVMKYFETGEVPVTPDETLEICAFMTAADESKKRGGMPVSIKEVMQKAEMK